MSESRAKFAKLYRLAREMNQRVITLTGELHGAMQILFILAEREAGTLLVTEEEMKSVPQDARIRVLRDPEEKRWKIVAARGKLPEEIEAEQQQTEPGAE